MDEFVFNIEQFDSFAGNTDEQREEMAKLFVTQMEDYFANLVAALKGSDTEEWCMSAHRMKGIASFAGAVRLYAVCQKAEQAAEADNHERKEMLDDIKIELGKAIECIRIYYKEA